MNKQLKAKWIKALRSGKYRQGTDCLKNGSSFCCLGVLAELQGAKWINGRPIFAGEDENGSVSYLAPRFAGGLGKSTQKTLAKMNDEAVPFKKIADYIESKIGAS